jgi:AhpD family alkylhydroperoxidase
MQQRIDYMKTGRGIYEAMMGIESYLQKSGLDPKLRHLIEVRASQINGCAYCIDMHWKDARALGESEQRLYGLDAWQESPYYTDRERAVLAWTEAITNIRDGHVRDEVFEEVKKFFTEKEIGDLTLAVAQINMWNRVVIPARVPAGNYQPGMHELKKGA